MDFGYDKQVIKQFTQGDCWLLAWELHKQGGFPLFVLFENDEFEPLGEKDAQRMAFDSWGHVIVKVGSDQYADITGIYSRSEFEAKWDMDLVKMPKKATKGFPAYMDWLSSDLEFSRYFDLPTNLAAEDVADEIITLLSVLDEERAA